VTPRRRDLLALAAGAAAVSLVRPALARATGRVVVVGGGFAGATVARRLRRIAPDVAVTLVEPQVRIVTCPFSNGVIAGLDGIGAITHGLAGLGRDGVETVRDRVVGIDATARRVRLAGGADIAWDRLVLAPGVDLKWTAIEGWGEAAAEAMPHAWKAGPQTLLLRRQLDAMADGGTVVMTVPPNPYRCPPGPYERASLIAHWLKTHRPRSKLIVLDAKDQFSKQPLFLAEWKRLYPDHLEWVSFSDAGQLVRVNPATRTVVTDFATVRADVANVIPPQRAGRLVDLAGLTDGGDWCRVDARSFESAVVPGIHVLGDAAIAGAMPKSAFAATAQAVVCAHAVAALLAGEAPGPPALMNVCYSLVAPDRGITVADVYRQGADGSIVAVPGAGGTSPLDATDDVRRTEADHARGWYAAIVAETWG
jgi:sulfide dehydrogenase [flavocytochrome c] flavoprotein subunit